MFQRIHSICRVQGCLHYRVKYTNLMILVVHTQRTNIGLKTNTLSHMHNYGGLKSMYNGQCGDGGEAKAIIFSIVYDQKEKGYCTCPYILPIKDNKKPWWGVPHVQKLDMVCKIGGGSHTGNTGDRLYVCRQAQGGANGHGNTCI